MSFGLTRRVALLVIIAVCPALVIQVWNEYDLRMVREADIRQKVIQNTQQLGEEIGELREGARQILLAIAQLDPVKLHQPEACRALLSKLKYRFPNYSLLGAAGIDGQIYCASMPTSASWVANQPFFTRAMAQPGLTVGNYWADPTNGQRMVHFAERFDDSDGYVAGVVFAGLDLAWLSDHLKARGWSPRTSILIADREGNIIVRLPHPETLVGKNMRKSHERIMDGNEAGWEEATGVDGVTRIFGYVPAALPPKDFFLSAGQSKAEAFAAIDRSTWRGIELILAGFFAAICVAWAGGRKFVRWPSPDARNDTGEGRIGDYDARTLSVAQTVNAIQSSSGAKQIPIAAPPDTGWPAWRSAAVSLLRPSAPCSPWKPFWTRRSGGPDWMPITPKTGSLFHADSQPKSISQQSR